MVHAYIKRKQRVGENKYFCITMPLLSIYLLSLLPDVRLITWALSLVAVYAPVWGKAWGRCWCHVASTGTAPPAPSHSRRPGTASPRESSPHSLCKSPVRRKQQLNPHIFNQISRQRNNVLTFILSARLSISEMHLVMMKGMQSLAQPATWAKSLPNSCRRPCSFLWPHWMARVSRQRLWHARKH